jgi:flagellar P-ring protein precursor FlgI
MNYRELLGKIRRPAPRYTLALAVALVLILSSMPVHAVRIKDITEIKGVRHNQLVGYGLVVGLMGTGDKDKTKFTFQSLASMLEKMGLTVNPEDIKVKNVAAVMVTADLPPFVRSGSRLDVLVSSIGDAVNLQGGTLLFTPLKATDGKVYAVAQGPVSTGGFRLAGAGAGVQKNFPTVGRVVEGALVERELANDFGTRETLTLMLQNPDFTTANRISQAVDGAMMGMHLANTLDAATIEILIPERYRQNPVGFVTLIEGLNVVPDNEAKVVINERTGTVVIGENVRISTVAIAHGNLSMQIQENSQVSQPLPFSRGGVTTVVPRTDVSAVEGKSPLFVVDSGVSIGDVVRALNALGVSPRDLISIFQAMKASGALQAKLEII